MQHAEFNFTIQTWSLSHLLKKIKWSRLKDLKQQHITPRPSDTISRSQRLFKALGLQRTTVRAVIHARRKPGTVLSLPTSPTSDRKIRRFGSGRVEDKESRTWYEGVTDVVGFRGRSPLHGFNASFLLLMSRVPNYQLVCFCRRRRLPCWFWCPAMRVILEATRMKWEGRAFALWRAPFTRRLFSSHDALNMASVVFLGLLVLLEEDVWKRLPTVEICGR